MLRELRSLGFSSTTYSETIVSFLHSPTNRVHTVPLGLRLARGRLWARIFPGTLTRKILETIDFDRCCICVTMNPILFYKAVLYRDNLAYRTIKVEQGKFLCVEKCDAYVLSITAERRVDSEYLYIAFEPIRLLYTRRKPRTANRAFFAILESLVYLTKMPYVDDSTRQRYLTTMQILAETVKRCSKSKAIRRAILDIIERAQALAKSRQS